MDYKSCIKASIINHVLKCAFLQQEARNQCISTYDSLLKTCIINVRNDINDIFVFLEEYDMLGRL